MPDQILYDIAAWSSFPMILFGSLFLAVAWIPLVGFASAMLGAQAVAMITIALVERGLPYRSAWNRAHGDVAVDAMHGFVSAIGTMQVARPFVSVSGSAAAAWLSVRLGTTVWPAAAPLSLQLALALVIAELPQYWLHRWQHEHEFLWRFHSVHHSVPRLYWLNAARFHPLDLGLLYVVGYLPLVILGCPVEVIFLFGLFDAVFGMLQHCNIDVRLGPLNRLFSMAEPHRWHHSRTLAEANTNYGSNLIVWDLVFATFYLPRDREPPAAIGIADLPKFPTSYAGQIAAPFRWRQIRALNRSARQTRD